MYTSESRNLDSKGKKKGGRELKKKKNGEKRNSTLGAQSKHWLNLKKQVSNFKE